MRPPGASGVGRPRVPPVAPGTGAPFGVVPPVGWVPDKSQMVPAALIEYEAGSRRNPTDIDSEATTLSIEHERSVGSTRTQSQQIDIEVLWGRLSLGRASTAGVWQCNQLVVDVLSEANPEVRAQVEASQHAQSEAFEVEELYRMQISTDLRPEALAEYLKEEFTSLADHCSRVVAGTHALCVDFSGDRVVEGNRIFIPTMVFLGKQSVRYALPWWSPKPTLRPDLDGRA